MHASKYSFCNFIQLDSAFYIKQDNYKVHVSRMHPGKQDGEMTVNHITDEPIIPCYYIRWYHGPSIYFNKDKDSDSDHLQQNSYDPKNIFGFTGKGLTLATQLLLSTELFRLRIGAGAGIRCSFLKKMIGQWVNNSQLSNKQDQQAYLTNYIPTRPYYFTWTSLLRLGFKITETSYYTLLIDGTWTPSIYTFSELGTKYYLCYPRTFDLGTTLEKSFFYSWHWSIRLAYGLSLYNEILEHSDPSTPDDLVSVSHYIGGIIFQVGIGIRIPIGGKCSIMGCHIKPDHRHGGKYYRGHINFRS
ncbi:hypothetical protein [Candidatus Cardinium sp. cByotN1]|nr:hypothetical protein [Candidatus Cardinium sp. cByotN1]